MIYSVHYDKGCECDSHFPNIALQFQTQICRNNSCKKYHNRTDEIEPAFNSQIYCIVLHISCYNISSIDLKPETKLGMNCSYKYAVEGSTFMNRNNIPWNCL